MRRLHVTREAARELVATGSEPVETAVYDEPEIREGWVPSVEVRLMRLESGWTLDGAGRWRASATFADSEGVGTPFEVYASIYPSGTIPPGTPGVTLFYGIWNTRWELLGSAAESSPGALTTKTVVVGLVATVSEDGWATLSTQTETIQFIDGNWR